MELSTLVFKADTTELERASKAVEQLTRDFAKVSISAQQAAKIEAQTQEIISRALLNDAKARKESAAAIDREIKTRSAADTADKKNEESKRKSTAATEKSTEASKKNVSILERQTDILKFQTEGWSKGQSSILATAKAAGVAAEEMQKLQEVLATQRRLMGTDPFDKSLSGLTSLKNQYTELKEAMRQYNSESGLTAKQTRELSRDKERLIERMKSSGASFQEIRQAMRAYNTEYSTLAGKLNQAAAQETAVFKARKDAASATEYLTQQDQKMAAALRESNAGLDKAGTDLLVRYERALKQSGAAQDVVTSKLAKYKTQLQQVQEQEEKRKVANLTRAAQPQITDIAVSLYSGQAPLTVLLQQGGQLTDLFKLSGVEAANFGKVMKDAFYGMIPAMATVAKGITGMVVGALADAGNAVVSFTGKTTGISAGMEVIKRQFAASGEAGFGMIGMLNKMTTAFAAVATGGIVILIMALVALAVEYKNIIASENALSSALNQSGASLGMTKDQVISYAQSLGDVAGGTLKASEALTAFIKVGDFTKEQLGSLTQSAVLAQKAFGTSLEDIAKEYQKLQEKPTEALTDIAIKTGEVTQQTLEQVRALEAIGDKQAAAKLATEAAQQANDAAAKRQLAGLSPIEKLWNDIKQGIVNAKEAIYDIAKSDVAVFALRAAWVALVAPITTVWGVLQGVGKAIGGVAAVAIEFIQGNYTKAWGIAKEVGNDAIDGLVAGGKKVVEMFTGVNDAVKDTPEMAAARKQQSEQAKALKENAEAINATQDKQLVWAQKQKHLQEQRLAGLLTEVQYNAALDGWKEKILGKEKKSNDNAAVKEKEKEVDVLNKLSGLTASYNNDLERLQNLRAKGNITEEEYVRYVEELIAMQPFAVKQQKEINEAHELENKLLGMSERLGKDYYKTREAIIRLFKDEVKQKQLLDALDASTPAAKEKQKQEEKQLETARKYNEELRHRVELQKAADLKLDMREQLLGKTSEQQKYIRIEQEKQLKLVDAQIAKEKAIGKARLDFEKDRLKPADYQQIVQEYENEYAEKVRQINRETAIIYAEDLDREIANIRSGITDSIVTALFEGGKEGSKKLRDVLLGTLRKRVTIVVDAVVNTLLGNVVGGFAQMLGLGGSGLGGGGGILGAAGNAASIGNTLGLFGGGGIFGTSAAYSAAVPGLTLGSQQAAMLASQTGVFGAQGLAATASAGGGSALGSALGSIGAGISTFGAGMGAGFSGLMGGLGLTGTGTTLGGTLSAGMTALGSGNIAGGLGTLTGALGPIALGIGALVAISKATKGETRTGGQFAIARDGQVYNQRRDQTYTYIGQQYDRDFSGGTRNPFVDGQAYRTEGDPVNQAQETTIKTTVSGTVDAITNILKNLGSKAVVTGFWAGLETSGKGRGGVYAGGSLSTGATFGETGQGDNYAGTLYEKFSSNSPDSKEALENFILDLKQSTLQALQQVTDIPKGVQAMLKDIDIESLDMSAVDELLNKIADYPNQLLQSFGSSRDDLVKTFTEGLATGDAMTAGQMVADQFVGGIEQTMLGAAAGQIFDIINTGVLMPILDGLMAGQSIAEVMSQASIDAAVAKAQQTATAFAAIWNDAKFQEVMGQIRTTVGTSLGSAGSALQYQPRYIQQPARERTQAADTVSETSKAAEDAAKRTAEIWKTLKEEAYDLETERLRIIGLEKEALSREREKATKEMNEEQKALWDLNQVRKKHNENLKKQKELEQQTISVAQKYILGPDATRVDYGIQAGKLIKAGLSGMNIDSLTSVLMSSTKDQIAQAVVTLWQLPELSLDQRDVLLQVADALAGMKKNAVDLINETAQALQAALSARNQAGELIDRINLAMDDDSGTYAKMREAELWAAIEVADYKQQIDLASQLTDIVLERQNKEIESARRQLDFAKQLKSFVESLKVGNLSPLTTAERLAEAQKQYYETFTKAQTGDEKAQSDLQNKAQTYLELARTYYASSPDYTAIFESVTGALDSFGFSAETDAQKQLAATNGSNEKLTQLKSILEKAYQQADLDYQGQKTLLHQQLTHLASTDTGVLLVANILKELPAEIAALMNGVIAGRGIYDPTTDTGVSGSGTAWNGANIRDFVREYYAAGGDMKEIYNRFKQEGYTLKQVDNIMQFPTGTAEEWAKAAGLPIYHSGIDYVPQTGPALLQRGERVISARNNAAMDFGALIQSNQLLREELQDVKAELVQLREENREDARMQVNATVQSNLEAAETVSQGMQKAEYSKNLNKKATLV